MKKACIYCDKTNDSIDLFVPDNFEKEDVIQTIKKISKEFCQNNVYGRIFLQDNKFFTLSDFKIIEDEYLDKYGIYRLDGITEEKIVIPQSQNTILSLDELDENMER